ncbi:TIGR03857 family LLM class F420-dependent oxidoreductase [Sphingobium sp. JS3065]|uniref:TIGR03857 family LLM class F420-dependent oxidoreductase n=1 Tax=Sphingobium sp. JS3065 TaxID=2970925 RepID=UPI0022656A0E|nr:TIGR03857 family LLM class F420-dependent oxidoreductase [Sphingobium sp. JS3065]UZW57035.1 TIGR03857 family LLM class F420-dependent oxidoreductase [Sphingobium sp. JS3065]
MQQEKLFPELGAYMLPGHIYEPLEAIEEIRATKALGIGSTWVAERFSAKNCDVMSGVAAALAPDLGIVAGLIQNLPLRHPIVTAGYGATVAKLNGGKFALGIGRGTASFSDATGTARINFKILGDWIDVLRRLWRNEIVNYEGPLGSFSNLRLGVELERTPPILVASMGEKTLKWAGGIADGVLLNSLWTPEAVERSVKLVRQGAEEAGRDPASVRVWTILMTACDVSEEDYLTWIVRRINTYLMFPALFDGICDGNHWDKSLVPGLRSYLAELDGEPADAMMGDEATTRDYDKLRRMAEKYPRGWIEKGCAIGSGADGARALSQRFEAGANSVLFHGSHPRDLRGVVTEWAKIRPSHLDSLPINAGFMRA